ncbi:MAG TPA: monovalent cation:proton antiporter-2 (CPA2) family protein [Burkholderiales bacterium]|nr:monovalent cation:proton antiporter-2 (CPA2) family protein [Burkholderiales bacterium]
MHTTLQLVLILLAAAVLVVVLFRHLKLPALLGYLLVGIVIGPHALSWIPEARETRYLAEFGVVFLMFSVGLEFSLPKLLTVRRTVFGLGAAQVGCSMLIVMLGSLAVGLNWQAGLALGGALAMSSTAIVSKMLADRLELATQHGRQIVGVLLFQDLAVVPLLIIVPALAEGSRVTVALGFAAVKALVVLIVILFVGQRLMRAWFHLVARQKSSELFVLNVLLITLGLAFFTEKAGLSLALGAFLAGMLISETEYRYQVDADIRPFRDVLLGLFFVTIGMLLDVRIVLQNWVAVSSVLVLVLLLKALLVAGLSRAFGSPPGVALRTALCLAQAGEFGFVLLWQAAGVQLLSPAVLQVVLAAMLLSMLAAPFIIEKSEHLVLHFSGAEWMNRAMQLHNIAVQTMAQEQHVIICGYGRSGQNLARFLEQENIRFVALDLDPQRVKEASAAGEQVVYGDAGRHEVLVAAGLMRAKALVVAESNVQLALKILSHVQKVRPYLPVLVRTVDDSDLDRLKQAGATEVVAEIMEGSLMLASHALMLLGVPLNRVLKRIRETRERRYELFHGFYHGITDATEPGKQQPRLQSLVISSGAAAVGKTLGEINLARHSVEVTAVRKGNIRGLAPSSETRIEAGDVMVLLGTEDNLAAAEMTLLQG